MGTSKESSEHSAMSAPPPLAVVSLVDDSLIVFCHVHILGTIRGLVALLSILMAIVIYGLMGLTPMIPKRLFLPLTVFNPLASVCKCQEPLDRRLETKHSCR